jgi:hypothetical protein
MNNSPNAVWLERINRALQEIKGDVSSDDARFRSGSQREGRQSSSSTKENKGGG